VIFHGVAAGDKDGHYFWEVVASRRIMLALGQMPDGLRVPAETWLAASPLTMDEVLHRPAGQDEPQGRAFVHHVGGWTVAAWWDRSADTRAGSFAAFFVEMAGASLGDVVELAARAFPAELSRMYTPYRVVPSQGGAIATAEDASAWAEQTEAEAVVRGFQTTMDNLPPNVCRRVLSLLGAKALRGLP
jgi:hypothetical protein